MNINKVKLIELENFINSDFYKNLEIKPISYKRAISYINNPHGKPEDVVLYYILDDKKLVAFRTIWADIIDANGLQMRFGWLSGNWVSPDFRGKGIARKIFKEIFQDWSGKLMLANYSPEGLKSNKNYLEQIYNYQGIRLYFKFSIRKRLVSSKFLKLFLYISDILIYFISGLFKIIYPQRISKKYNFQVLSEPDEDCLQMAESYKHEFVFGRGRKELEWIFSYPWVTDKEEDYDLKYIFSTYAEEFYYKVVKVSKEDRFLGFFIFSVRDGHLKTLYFCFSGIEYKVIAKWLKRYVVNENLAMMTVYNKKLTKVIKLMPFPFLFIRKLEAKIYSTFEFTQIDSYIVQDGDGDYFFT
ncbi:MAG: GNAT family N-acetyltransferase [Bacteroidales bacterium]|jgi:GNAT superfamily N-acetyltransferase|nr:GNAT family N-acetyltransferase [Bacteroidales bacterium]